MNYNYTEEILKYKRNKKLKGIFIGIGILLVAIIGSTYAFFTYSKSLQAFTLTSSGITASFTSGSNQINITNGYPISDEFAIQNLNQLDYIDFTVSGNVEDEDQGLSYEIYLTEDDNNTLDPNYIKVYITDENGQMINSNMTPKIYNSLDNTTYSKDSSTGKVIYKLEGLPSNYNKSFRIYAWIDKDYEQNVVSQEFSFYVNLYAYNDTNKLGSDLIKKAALARANDGSNCLTTVEEDGIIYISGSKTCIDFNYVWYSGKLWRITAIYPDGSMKMITEDLITAIYWGSSIEYDGSYIYQWLNEDFKDTLINSNSILKEDAIWNYSTDGNSTPVKPETVATQKTKIAPIGLLNVYEYYKSCQNTTYGNGYLNIGYSWWLITPYSGSYVRTVSNIGSLYRNSPSLDASGSRPTVILQSDILLTGSGTKNDPYKISGNAYNAANDGDLLNTRFSGEYVNFDGDLYRIVSTEDSVTKLTRIDYIRDGSNNVVNKNFASTVYFGKSTNTQTETYWDYYLNNTWYNSISPIYKSMIIDGTFYLGSYISGNYKRTICKDTVSELDSKVTKIGEVNSCTRYTSSDTDKTYVGKVGLQRFGEMFSSQLGSGSSSSTFMWLITPGSSLVCSVSNFGELSNRSPSSDAFGSHPSINLKSTIIIAGGTGLEGDPYTIEDGE